MYQRVLYFFWETVSRYNRYDTMEKAEAEIKQRKAATGKGEVTYYG